MENTAHELGIGIVGAGFMGQTYARTVVTLISGARLAGVAEGSRAPELASKHGVPCFRSCRELVASDAVHLVCVATPHAQHGPHALAAAAAGKHVLIDKPMASSVEECDAILAACRDTGAKCSITYTQRNRIGVVQAREALASGALGRVLQIRTYQIVPAGIDAVPKWQLEPANAGILLGHGIHNFDLIRALTGREIVSVFAKCRSLAGAPVEATSDVILTTDDGAVHYLFCSFEVPKPGFPRSEVGVRVVCEKGLLDIDPYGETRISRNGAAWQTLAVQPAIDWAGKGFLDPVRLETYATILQDLVDAAHEGRDPAITGWDGRQAVAAVLAAYESSRSGGEARLDLPKPH
ncbi:MAG: Gfo/Idh/MocA family oxidoreductase [Candidatus Hydrogenedentes bacterium]|nr:Gfo/Idh/MocA family oxidoreductase [Candidatus Hydrogenedentota bacterium]